jgi:pimeloyl-ACP methyl ester carboxylesterase
MTGQAQEMWIATQGETLHVLVDGSDGQPTVLLLHGFLGSSRWFDRLVPLLRPDYRVVRVDLAGHGGSTDHDRLRSPMDQARYLSFVVDQLHLSPIATVGHSLGANVAIAAAESGVVIGDLVILGEGPDYSVATPPWINRVLRAPVIGPQIWKRLPEVAIRRAVSQFFAKGFDTHAAFDDPRQPVLDTRAVSHRTFVRTQDDKEQYVAVLSLAARIRELGLRALVIFGDQDHVFDSGESLRIYAANPNVTTALLPGVGHASMLEAPAEIATAIRRFIGNDGTGTLPHS